MRRHRLSRPMTRRGAMAVWCAVLTPIVLILGVFAVELSYMHLVRIELRTATDAAAHAGGRMLSISQDPNVAIAAAKSAALANQVAGRDFQLATSDIELGRCAEQAANGHWSFSAGATPPNAIRVTGRRTAGSPSGAVPLLFAGVFSRTTFEPVKTAVSVQIDRDIMLVQDRSSSMVWPVSVSSETSGYVPNWSPGSPPPASARWYDSMRALQAFRAELDSTPTTEYVGLCSFATDARRDCDLTATYNTVQNALVQMTMTYPGGYTHIDDGMRAATSALLDRGTGRPLADKVIVFMTDGRHNGAGTPQDCINLAAAAHARGATVHAITFSDEADQDLMTRMATAGGGKHWHASDEAALTDAYRTIARTVTTMLIQ